MKTYLSFLFVLQNFTKDASGFTPSKSGQDGPRGRTAPMPAVPIDLNSSFEIPIFPLRKTVKLPSESITLNLYEIRYLIMSEYILSQPSDSQYFGAIYSSNKPQIIPKSDGPIVPILEVGDIGVLFQVKLSEDCLIPTNSNEKRRRIRLVGEGVARFQIANITSRGIGRDDSATEEKGENDNLPFIMATCILYVDEQDDLGGGEGNSVVLLKSTPSISQTRIISNEEFQSFVVCSKNLKDTDWAKRLTTLRLRSSMQRVKEVERKELPFSRR